MAPTGSATVPSYSFITALTSGFFAASGITFSAVANTTVVETYSATALTAASGVKRAYAGTVTATASGSTGTCAVTLNQPIGQVSATAVATTASGGTLTFTVTNSLVASSSIIFASAYQPTSATGSVWVVQSITPGTGTFNVVLVNGGATASGATGVVNMQFELKQ